MSARRLVSVVLLIVLLLGATALVGCGSAAEDATFVGYKQRPTDTAPNGIAIIQLEDGTPVQATCTYTSLENGTPVRVQKSGDTYKIVASSPDWKQ